MTDFIKFKKEYRGLVAYNMTKARVVGIRPATESDRKRLAQFWYNKYGVRIGLFAEVYKVKFEDTKQAYDFPSILFEPLFEDGDEL